MKSALKKSAAIVLCVVLVLLFDSCGKRTPEHMETTETTKFTEVISSKRNILTGEKMDNDAARVVAVMVENSPSARPQWGISTPDIIVEGQVEGGITRMMWLYQDVSNIQKIGPTRSARHDYIELAQGFDAVYIHFGASNIANQKIKREKVDDIDGVVNGQYFKRDKSRNVSMEHTAYTNGAFLTKAFTDKGFDMSLKEKYSKPFKFNEQSKILGGGSCISITFKFSDSYRHTFKYNAEDKMYYNYMGETLMKDGVDGSACKVQNVLVLYCPVALVPGDNKLMNWDLSGGEGVYVSNGTYQKIKWSKGNENKEPLKLIDESGNELALNKGKSYIGFVNIANISATSIS
ncbi:MAG: DUF3048 domain-containing protein [Candidatus Fimenecus sp.]